MDRWRRDVSRQWIVFDLLHCPESRQLFLLRGLCGCDLFPCRMGYSQGWIDQKVLQRRQVRYGLVFFYTVVFFFWLLSDVYAGTEIRLDTLFMMDNRFFKKRVIIEEWIDITYTNRRKDISSNLSVAGRLCEDGWYDSIYKLYVEGGFNLIDTSIRFGRFEHIGPSGYLILDGASIKTTMDGIHVEFYGGSTRRIEDYIEAVDTRWIGGIDLFFSGRERYIPVWLNTVEGRIGYYRIDPFDTGEDGFTWSGFISGGRDDEGGWFVVSEGNVVAEGMRAERVSMELGLSLFKKGEIRTIYEMYNPDSGYLTLRDRFYLRYTKGYERTYGVDIHYPLKSLTFYWKGRRGFHGIGKDGYSTLAGLEKGLRDGMRMGAEAVYIKMEEDTSFSMFTKSRIPLSERSTIKVDGMWQLQRKETTGKNIGAGFYSTLEMMLQGDIFVSIYAMHVWNDNLDDEYMAGVRVTKFLNYSY